MKKKWWLIAATTIAGSVGLAVAAVLILRSRPGVTEANFDRIQIGMSSLDVEAILGQPSKRRPNGYHIWENDRADEGHIVFDKDNRVLAKEWDGWPVERHLLEKLTNWLPWRERKKLVRPATPPPPSLVH